MGGMDNKKLLLIPLLALLVFGGFGTIPVLAASGMDVFGSDPYSGAFFTDPGFLSPDWKAPAVTSTFADPAFLSKDWAVPNLNSQSVTGSADLSRLYADPFFLSPGWKVPSVSPLADPGFLYPNWSVPTITPFADSKFMSSNWSVPALSSADSLLQVYDYYPGTTDPFRVPDQSQKNSLPSYDPFASNPGSGWTTGGYLF